MRPATLYVTALLLMAGLLAWAERPPPLVAIEDAPRHAGADVAMQGIAHGAERWRDGYRFLLQDGPWAVPVTASEAPPAGAWTRVEGRLSTWNGDLSLEASAWRARDAPDAAAPGWAALASSPQDWVAKRLRLDAAVVDGHLIAPDGARLRLGSGPWPDHGPVQATGTLLLDGRCFCYRFHATEVAARNS